MVIQMLEREPLNVAEALRPGEPDLEVARSVLATEAAGLTTLAAGLGPEARETELLSSAGDLPVPNAKSDHVMKVFVDNEIPGRSGPPPENE